MARRAADDRPGDSHPTLGARSTHPGPTQLHVTAGGVLTPVLGFKGQGITGTPPAPAARGFTNEPGDGTLPGGTASNSPIIAKQAYGIGSIGLSLPLKHN